jgi:PAS domain-containing protein
LSTSPDRAATAARYALAAFFVALATLLQPTTIRALLPAVGRVRRRGGVRRVAWRAWSRRTGCVAVGVCVGPRRVARDRALDRRPRPAGVFDASSFLTLALIGGALGWVTRRLRSAESTLRERERELVQARDRLETAVERTERLRASEERYALAMEAAGEGHTDWNVETGEFYVSPRLLDILGHPPGTTFADRADWVRRLPLRSDDRKRWEAAVADHFAGPNAKFQMDLRIAVDGRTRWVAFNYIATRDDTGKVVRWTGSIADVDEAKRDVATVLDTIRARSRCSRAVASSTS